MSHLRIPTKQLPSSAVTRFAPAPTGHLHLGHLLSLLYVHAAAHASEGTLLLRIEDHDRERSSATYEESIIDDVAWIGISGSWIRQSDNEPRYKAILEQLSDHTYYCTCSRKEMLAVQEETAPELRYSGRCRGTFTLPDGEHGIRWQMSDAVVSFHDLLCGEQQQHPARQCGDLLLHDRRGNFTYNFAVVVDDIVSGVNLIVRGADLLHCTGRQQLLARQLGYEQLITYAHHPLLWGDEGKKLSKRDQSTTLRSRREEGATVEELIGEALHLASVIEEQRPVSLEESVGLLLDEG